MPIERTDLLTAAAWNNAQWCDTVCRSHGVVGTFAPGMWTSAVRTPRLYPDAVTLDPSVVASDVLGAVDSSPGCTIKDSFATLDLVPAGFEVLFDATWIACPSGKLRVDAENTITWARVTTLTQFDAWERAWRGADSETAGILVPSLLSETSVEVLIGTRHGATAGGAILNCDDHVVGLSNVFSPGGVTAATWSGIGAWIARSHPGRNIVGYESGTDLETALGAGFGEVGPLRVWSRALP